jgi:hypothetical protein
VRIRLTADVSGNWLANPLPYGYRASGEVEDYDFLIVRYQPYPDFALVDKDETLHGDVALNDNGVNEAVSYFDIEPRTGNPTATMPVLALDGTYTFSSNTPGIYQYTVYSTNGVDTLPVLLVITVLDPADLTPPATANLDVAETKENNSVTIPTLANDFPGRFGSKMLPETVEIVTAPIHGTATVDPLTGNVTYVPQTNFVGTDTLIYRVKDDLTDMWVYAQQYISVAPAESPNSVLAVHDVFVVPAGLVRTYNVLDNDFDAEDNNISATVDTIETDDYIITIDEDGNVTVYAEPGFNGIVTVPYAICDDGEPQACSSNIMDLVIRPALVGYVWEDDNFNGRREDDREENPESRMGDVVISLLDASGMPIAGYTATSAADGAYVLPMPAAGSYQLQANFSGMLNAEDYKFTVPNIENNTLDSIDSDFSFAEGKTASFTIGANNATLKFDVGIFLDADNDFRPDGRETEDQQLMLDPLGVIYCETTGEIIRGGSVSATGPGNVYMVYDGSNGFYQFFVDAAGTYTIEVTNPTGYNSSLTCLAEMGPLDVQDTITLGSGDLDMNGFIDDILCESNPFYFTVTLGPGDLLLNNNFPVMCLDFGDLDEPYATTLADNGARHSVLQTPKVHLGSKVDFEDDGQPEAEAGVNGGGDDGNSEEEDDEDGIATMPTFIITVPSAITINVVNDTTTAAYLSVMLDIDNDGAFTGDEIQDTVIAAGYVGPVNITYTPPVTAPVGVRTGLRVRISSEDISGPLGEAKDGEVEDYTVLFAGFDYGDLAQSYNTAGNNNPPAHIISADLMLGSSVDAEVDGFASADGRGDDTDPGLVTFGTPGGEGDEDGVELMSPLIPGNEAIFRVNAVNNTGSGAVLQAWIDYNGSGTFEEGEALTSGDFAPAGAEVPTGGLTDAMLSFEVPADAVFNQGQAMIRFRLSEAGGLAADSEESTPPFGEIEDYVFTLSQVGNLVWEDVNGNGLQDAEEPGLAEVTVALIYYGEDGVEGGTGFDADRVYEVETDEDGLYAIWGLIDGNYSISLPELPEDYVATAANRGDGRQPSTPKMLQAMPSVYRLRRLR